MSETEPIFQILARALDVAALRQAVHTANIANANVEGYRRLEVAFDAELLRAASLHAGAELSASFAMPRVVPSADTAVRLDQEMAQMAQNALRYQALLGAFDRSAGTLRLAIREGREG